MIVNSNISTSLQLLVSVGGWTYSKHFSNCASSQAGIEMFYKTFAFRANEMDKNWGKSNAIWNGIDFDWVRGRNCFKLL